MQDYEPAEYRCRGRREMRHAQASSLGDSETIRTLAAQGYQLMSTSLSEPEQLAAQRRWREEKAYLQDWNQRKIVTASSTEDLRRSPMEHRKSRCGAAVRRSRSTVGDDRRRAPAVTTPETAIRFPPARSRNSTLLTNHDPSAGTSREITPAPVAREFSTGAGQWSRYGWYYGLDGRQTPVTATAHNMAYHPRPSDQLNLTDCVEPDYNLTDVGRYPVVATTMTTDAVWNGHAWTTPRLLRTSLMPVDRDVVQEDRTAVLLTPNGASNNGASHEK